MEFEWLKYHTENNLKTKLLGSSSIINLEHTRWLYGN